MKSEGPFSAERDLYSEAAGADAEALPLRDRIILVVEDDSLIADHLAVILKDAGHACNLEDPMAFDAAVMAFLADHGLMPKHPS